MCSVEMYSSLRRLASSLARSMIRLDARGDKDLSRAAAEDVGFGAGAQGGVETFSQRFGADAQFFQNLGDDSAGLFDQRQQDVFGIDLVVPVALDDLRGALGGFLCSLCKSVKSHHGKCSFSSKKTLPVSMTVRVYCDKGNYNKTALTVCQRGIRGVLEFEGLPRRLQLLVRRCGFVVAASGKACLLIPC